MPDLFNGDPVTDAQRAVPGYSIDTWRLGHKEETWIPIVDGVVKALKEQGVTRIGTTGYCFGAPAAFRLAFANESHVTVLNHPSMLKAPEDLEVSHCLISRECQEVERQ